MVGDAASCDAVGVVGPVVNDELLTLRESDMLRGGGEGW